MKDSIHKRLTDHIRKTVGRYEVPYEPGSWEEFQRLQRSQRPPLPLISLRYALAACLLLGMLGVPLWLDFNAGNPNEVANNRSKTRSSVSKPVPAPTRNHQSGQAVVPDAPVASIVRQKPSSPKKTEMNQPYTAWNNTSYGSKLVRKTGSEKRQGAGDEPRMNTENEPAKPALSGPTYGISEGTGPMRRLEKTVALAGRFEIIPLRPGRAYRWSVRPLGLPLRAYAEEQAAKVDPLTSSFKPILGVSLAPQSVYAPGSSPSTAVGGGVFSEIPLNRRLSVSTGLSMARQTLGTKEPGVFAMANRPTLVATDIRLVAVDWPINVRFRPQKASRTGFYAELGLSSLAFLNEQYAEVYQQIKPVTILVMGTNGEEHTVTQYVTQEETVNRSEPGFQKIYWGRIVNLSIGVERRLGDRMRLSAEPYLKYPVGPFTRENLLLGSGGVSLRLGFQAGRPSK
ncbi:hypothetical protein GCM10027347_33950 [Larkinella harenae]